MNKILLIVICSLFLLGSNYSLSIFAEEVISSETIDHNAEYNLEMVIGTAHWLTGIGTVVLALWYWHCGIGTVVLALWYWHCGIGTVVLALWYWHCGIGTVVLALWYWHCGIGTVVLALWYWHCGIGTVVLAIILIRTFKHMEAVTKITSIETEYRLRPWVGPIGPIKKMEKSISDDCQFDIAIKNFGELPANGVIAKFVRSTEPVTLELLRSADVDSFNLGPVMPTMEKHYWFFIDSEIWKKADSGSELLYTGLYFEYDVSGKKDGYGMLSEHSSSSKNFIHKDMWID